MADDRMERCRALVDQLRPGYPVPKSDEVRAFFTDLLDMVEEIRQELFFDA